MSQTATQSSTQTKPAAIQLPCLCCGEPMANVSVNLWQLDGDEAITCQECNGEFSLAHVRDVLGKWSKVLAWLEAAPQLDAE